MPKKGVDILKAYDDRLRAERDATTCPAICQWCGERFEGTLKETRLAYAEHLASDHPEVKAIPRRAKQSRTNIMRTTNGKTIHDNISGARAQGAAAWSDASGA